MVAPSEDRARRWRATSCRGSRGAAESRLVAAALREAGAGSYALQAAIAALHAEAPRAGLPVPVARQHLPLVAPLGTKSVNQGGDTLVLNDTTDAGDDSYAAMRSFIPPIHFRREDAVKAALKSWTAPRLERAMEQLSQKYPRDNEASIFYDTRKLPWDDRRAARGCSPRSRPPVPGRRRRPRRPGSGR